MNSDADSSPNRSHRTHLRSLTPNQSPVPVKLLVTRSYSLPYGHFTLLGDLVIPAQATGLVLFAHVTGSCRRSSRSRHMTRLLQQADLATFSVDVLTSPEVQRRHDAPAADELLQQRLTQVVDWLQRQPSLVGLRLGLLGEGTSAAALLTTCPQLGSVVGAAVALGRTTLGQAPAKTVPTLLLVGEQDADGRRDNEQLRQLLGAAGKMEVIPHADRLFQEPGTLAAAMDRAAHWYTTYLAKARSV